MKNLRKLTMTLMVSVLMTVQTVAANAATTIPDTMVEKEYSQKVVSQLDLMLTPKAMEKINKFQFYIINKPVSQIPGLQINLSNDNVNKSPETSQSTDTSIKALTIPGEKKVIISKVDGYYYNTIWHVYHEALHCLDTEFSADGQYIRNGLYSNTDEYKSIAQSEWPALSVFSHYKESNFNMQEEFAEAFAIYLIQPDRMRSVAPKTCAYIDNLGFVKPEELKGKDTTDNHWTIANNDWAYCENGKRVTGWKQIDGKWYFFNPDGKEIKNTEVDGYKLDQNGTYTAN